MEDYRKIAIELGQTLISKAPETRKDVERMLPELKESEDKKIRKALKQYFVNSFQNNGIAAICGVHIKDVLAWLERQAKQKPAVDTKVIIPKFRVGDIVKSKSQPMLSPRKIISIGKDCYWCEDRGCIGFAWEDDYEIVEQKPTVEMKTPEESLGIDSDTYNKIVDECVYGEQKPKVEPKFKQGDIIKEKETGNLFYVNSIEDFGYTLHYKNCIAKGCTMSFKYEDNYELVEQKPADKVEPKFKKE